MNEVFFLKFYTPHIVLYCTVRSCEMNKITRYTTPGCKHILPTPPYLSSSYSLKIPQIQMAKNYTSLFDGEKKLYVHVQLYFIYIYN